MHAIIFSSNYLSLVIVDFLKGVVVLGLIYMYVYKKGGEEFQIIIHRQRNIDKLQKKRRWIPTQFTPLHQFMIELFSMLQWNCICRLYRNSYTTESSGMNGSQV